MNPMSSAVTVRPRYLHSLTLSLLAMPECGKVKNGTQGLDVMGCDRFYALTFRQTGGASVSGFPAARSTWA
jgi:hypothetical protein